MTARSITKEALLQVLENAACEPFVPQSIEAVSNDEREVFPTGTASARSLLRSLETKLSFARAGGRIVNGGDELLLRLHERQDAPVQGVVIEEPSMTLTIYVAMDEKAVLGCLQIEHAPPDQE